MTKNASQQQSAPNKFAATALQKSDAELLAACRRSDEQAWHSLVERFERLVATIPRRAGLSEDLTAEVFQEVFLTLFEKMNDIEQPERLRAWLVTTAKFKTWRIVSREKVSGTVWFVANSDGKISRQTFVELKVKGSLRPFLPPRKEKIKGTLEMTANNDSPLTFGNLYLDF